MPKAKKPVAAPTPPREPTAEEAAMLAQASERFEARPARPEINSLKEGNAVMLAPPHRDYGRGSHAVYDAIGTRSAAFADDTCNKLFQMVSTDGTGGINDRAVNASLALMAAIQPRDEVEGALASQIAAAHHISFQLMAKVHANAEAGFVDAANSYGNLATKFSRTMLTAVEALSKLRGGGKQIVEHRYYQVNANQVVAGDVNMTPPPLLGKDQQPYGPVPGMAFAQCAEMPCSHAAGHILPVASNEGAEALPDTRGI